MKTIHVRTKEMFFGFDESKLDGIEGMHLKNGEFREILTFTDGSKIKVVYDT